MDTPRPMTRAILATDGSPQASAAVAFAAALAWPLGSVISVASVIEAPPPDDLPISRLEGKGFADWRRVLDLSHVSARDQALSYASEAAAGLRKEHPEIKIDEVVRAGEPATELLALAPSSAADVIIAGARGRTALQSLLLGSVSEALVTEAPCPVLIAREQVAEIRTVLVALHSTDEADRLAEVCLRLPLPSTTRLIAVSVNAHRPLVPAGRQPFPGGQMEALLEAWDQEEQAEAEAAGQRFVDRVHASAPDRVVELRIIRGELQPSPLEARSDVAPALLAEADAVDASLIIVGGRERRGFTARLGLGSVSRKVVRRATGAVLVVREPSAS